MQPPRQKLSQLNAFPVVAFAAALVRKAAFANQASRLIANKRFLAMLAEGGFLKVRGDALPFGCHAA